MALIIHPWKAGPLQQFNVEGKIAAHFPRPQKQFEANEDVIWSIEQGGGSIDERGVFYPPDIHGKSVIKATSLDKHRSALAEVTYHCGPYCKLHPRD